MQSISDCEENSEKFRVIFSEHKLCQSASDCGPCHHGIVQYLCNPSPSTCCYPGTDPAVLQCISMWFDGTQGGQHAIHVSFYPSKTRSVSKLKVGGFLSRPNMSSAEARLSLGLRWNVLSIFSINTINILQRIKGYLHVIQWDRKITNVLKSG